ncbi:hypothetical protein [Pseudomonas xantholysinigenes]|uniref:Phosphatidylinositol diacylglycerol-lyase n=1 Tax=Pseudomonas xantholysinigenes TaxID=2745490 RepID=A0A9E6TXS6_9PSED|nr:hypothetical protein [Pseudomonas xantholysinigenes]QXI38661.1 hypothetical protein HU772_000765 [Pseudomonas xantholysinigenes]
MSNENWMGKHPELGRLRIDQLILPGSHDSGMDKQAPNYNFRQEVTQDVPCLAQLRGGIRVLDLRVQAHRSFRPDQPERYQLYHLKSSGRTVLGDVVMALETFYRNPANAKEIVILDLHQFDGFSNEEHSRLQELLEKHLNKRMIDYNLRDLTLDQLWQQRPGKTVVIAYNGPSSDRYWRGVAHGWIGSNTPSTTKLKAFMDEWAQKRKQQRRLPLSSIQCAKYNKLFFTPDDFSDKIDAWFESKDINSYIQNFRIINTDWSLRSRIVDNCIHANYTLAKDQHKRALG